MKMFVYKAVAFLALVLAVKGQEESNDILRRSAFRHKYEAELMVGCNTGDDVSCLEYFFSVHRVHFAIAAAVLLVLIVISCIVCCCCYCKRRRSSRESRFSGPSFEAVAIHPDSRSKQSLLSRKA